MLDLKLYTDFAQKMNEFSEIMTLAGISFNDLAKLDEICPISNDLLIIKNWWSGKVTKTAKTTKTEVKPEAKPEPKVETPKQDTKKKETRGKRGPYNKLTNDRAAIISEYIATRHNDDTFEETLKDCADEFKESPKTIQRLLEKTTFVPITDRYFKVHSGRIVAVLTEKKNIFGSNQSDIKLIKDLLKDCNYNVVSAITEDMSANDVVKLAMVRLAMFKHGEIDSIGGGVKEIFIMEAIASNRSGNNDAIIKAVNKKYGVTCTPELVSAVRTGRSHKEIFARF